MIERNPPYQGKVVEAKLAVPRSGDAAYSDGPTSAAHMCAPRREPVGTSDLKEQLEQAQPEHAFSRFPLLAESMGNDPHSGLPPDWEAVCEYGSEHVYYWNRLTNETTWQKPVDAPLARKELVLP